jgi:uncharacterized membrane protein YjjP (DUF1212 family)
MPFEDRGEPEIGKVDRLNSLSREICACPIPVAELKGRIQKIREQKKYPTLLLLGMYGMISFAFSVFFGGSFSDGACSFLSGLVLFGLLLFNSRFGLNNILQIMLCSAGCAVSAILFSRIGIGTHADKIMIGNIMLVIPGVLLTTSIRDMINGDLISGAIGIVKVPVLVLLTPMTIPMIPGSDLYYTMDFLVNREFSKFGMSVNKVLSEAFAMALGIAVSSYLVKLVTKQRNRQ